jgi:hypothetical protein
MITQDSMAFIYDASMPTISLSKMFSSAWLERSFTQNGGEGNYGVDLASVWTARTQK